MLLDNLNEQQKQAVTHGDGPLLIVAGAGTGKTTVITRRVAWLIEQGRARGDEILALTFTDKAAGEMEERVDRLLPYGYVDLWISTFHSFCDRILKDHGLEIGLPIDYKLLDQTEQWLIVRQNLDKFNLDYYRPLGNPTKFIHAFLKHFSRCKDEVIQPGDYLEYAEGLKLDMDSMESTGGKIQDTRYKDTNNFQFPISNFQKNSKSQTSNSKQEKVGAPLVGAQDVGVSEIKRLEEAANAYHVYQQLLLDNNSLDFGDLINYALKLFRERPHILKKYRDKFKYILVDEFQDTNWAQYELVKMLAGEKENLTVVADDDQSIFAFRGASMSNVLQFQADYPKLKSISLIENYRSTQNILDLAYNFIQLNNPERLEYKLQRKMESSEPSARDSDGDAKEAEALESLKVPSTRGGGTDGRGLSKKLKAQGDGEGVIEHLRASSEEEEINLVVNKILEIYGTKSSGPDITSRDSDGEGVTWNDFCILVRANRQAEGFANALERAGIPYQYVASKGLYGKPVVMDLAAYLKLLDNYHESTALWRVLNMPVFDLEHKDLVDLNYLSRRKGWSLFESLKRAKVEIKLKGESYKLIDNILSLIDRHSRLAKEKPVSAVVMSFLIDSGYEKYLAKDDSQAKRDSLRYLNQFYKKIQEFEKSFNDKSVKNFMAMMDLELESGEMGSLAPNLEEGPEAVKLMTVHTAKGLEFKYVFIVQMVDKRFPSIERRDPIHIPDALVKEIIPQGDIHLQEERRLFYVAMTRAKQGLYLTSADDYGGTRKKKLSRFIYEVGMENIKSPISNIEKISNIQYLISKQFPISNFQFSKGGKKYVLEYQLPEQFSYTQLKAFETCPLQYKLAHVLRVPVRGRFNFSFGKTMHATLEKFFQLMIDKRGVNQGSLFVEGNKDTRYKDTNNFQFPISNFQKNSKSQISNPKEMNLPPLSELLNIYESCWIDDWYEDEKHKSEYKAKGRKALKEFYEIVKENPPQVKFLEKGFNLKVGEYTIKGMIDRVDEVEGGLRIVDYKTGSSKSEKYIDKDQLYIYQLAAEEVLKEEVKSLVYYYIEDNRGVEFLGDEKNLNKVKGKILEDIEAIKNSSFEADPSQFKCRWCDFKEICEYKQ